MALILADTTVLNNFAQIRRPDLLRQAFDVLYAPEEVRKELVEGERRRLVPPCDWSWLRIIEPTDQERSHAEKLREILGSGEAACIAILVVRGGLLLTDDGPARGLAASLGLELSGTIGVLNKLLQSAALEMEQGDAFLKEMIARGYRSPVRSLRQIT